MCIRGKLYKPYRQRICMEGEDISIDAVLSPLVDVEAMGLYAFDGHSHVSRDRGWIRETFQRRLLS